MDIAATSEVLLARSWPDTPEEYLSSSIGLLIFVGTLALSGFCFLQFMKAWRRAYEARLIRESREFRARWPREQLGQAPYVELEAEIERSWQLVQLLEARAVWANGGREALGDSAAVRGWASSLAGLLNTAALRERQ